MARRRKQKLRPDEAIEEHIPALVLVAGGRDFGCWKRDGKLDVSKRERDFIYDEMNAICDYGADGESLPIILMHGACPTGVDLVVDKWAERNLIPVKRVGLAYHRRAQDVPDSPINQVRLKLLNIERRLGSPFSGSKTCLECRIPKRCSVHEIRIG